MEPQDKCELIADEIKRILSKGIDLSDDVVHYIDSTFSNPTIEELQGILADDSNCEKDSLMELLFFPDESIQIQLEETLEGQRPQEEDENKVWTYLSRDPLQVTFRFDDKRGYFNLPITEDVTRGFLSRLNISKHLEPALIASIIDYGDEANRNRFKVKIRNSRFFPTTEKTDFLCKFFDKIGAQSNDIFECLEFVLAFLDEIKKEKDIYWALMDKKKFYFISLQKAQKMDARLEKNNVETLMSQGERVVLIDQADIRKRMRIIDRISQAVFGKTEYFDQPVGDEMQMEVGSPEALKSIVKYFSP
ncbi:MAG: hypothetical protein WBM69_12220 [Desulfobacterales bacterium]